MATLKDPESYIPASKIAILGNAVTAACDALDGIADGVLDDPRKCKFDPSVLTCTAAQDPSTCYTSKQVQAIKDIWSGVRTPSGELVHPPLVPGAESVAGGWATWTTGAAPFTGLHFLAADGFFRYMVFENPTYDPFTFNFGSDLDFALAKVGPELDAINPDLRGLNRRKAKLIVYHGWSDSRYISAQHRQLFRERGVVHSKAKRRPSGCSRTCQRILSRVHGARNATLLGRPWPQQLRHAHGT